MKKFLFFIYSVIAIITFFCCQSENERGERLAHTYCASCHLFPEPSLLDKSGWEQGVLPQMGFRMGFPNLKISLAIPPADLALVYKQMPSKPMVTNEEWELIKKYYLKNAPDSLVVAKETSADSTLVLFDTKPIAISGNDLPMITLIKSDTDQNKILIGTRSSMLFQYNNKFELKDTFHLHSPPSSLQFETQNEFIISDMGNMDPNDQTKGELIRINSDKIQHTFIDSLKRPVFFEVADLDNDKQDDYIVCEFGNFTGALVAYKNLGNQKFEKHIIYGLPGARKVVVRDVNHDGLQDLIVLMTQGDEQISLLMNSGDFKFRIKTLLRFPPIYGSSFIDIVDFNHDGNFDILYTNGDNADFSTILKPYHGVRIFINDGKNTFTESWFYPMPGASQALARDFDGDGDIDIAAISFFPDFKKHPEHGFIYFDNTGKTFIPHTSPLAKKGRWLVMEATDVDRDGDCDLLIGALDFNSKIPEALMNQWKTEKTGLLYLKNKTKP